MQIPRCQWPIKASKQNFFDRFFRVGGAYFVSVSFRPIVVQWFSPLGAEGVILGRGSTWVFPTRLRRWSCAPPQARGGAAWLKKPIPRRGNAPDTGFCLASPGQLNVSDPKYRAPATSLCCCSGPVGRLPGLETPTSQTPTKQQRTNHHEKLIRGGFVVVPLITGANRWEPLLLFLTI